MQELIDVVEWVTRKLEASPGKVKAIAKRAGVGYDAAYRISKRSVADPGYRTIMKLAVELGFTPPIVYINGPVKQATLTDQ